MEHPVLLPQALGKRCHLPRALFLLGCQLTPTPDQIEGLSKEDSLVVPVVSSPGHCWIPAHLSSAGTLILYTFTPSLCRFLAVF